MISVFYRSALPPQRRTMITSSLCLLESDAVIKFLVKSCITCFRVSKAVHLMVDWLRNLMSVEIWKFLIAFTIERLIFKFYFYNVYMCPLSVENFRCCLNWLDFFFVSFVINYARKSDIHCIIFDRYQDWWNKTFKTLACVGFRLFFIKVFLRKRTTTNRKNWKLP